MIVCGSIEELVKQVSRQEAPLRIIELDGSGWKTPLDFLQSLHDGIEQGPPHGMSPDAFVDSMIWRGMGGAEPPYTVRVINLKSVPDEVTNEVLLMISTIEQARQWRLENTGVDVNVSISAPELSR
jgi:hypothetical protein